MVNSPAAAQSLAALTHDLERCPLCNGRKLGSVHFAYLHDAILYPAVRCADCGLTFLSRQPNLEGLSRLYDAEYFDSDYHCGHDELPYFAGEAGETASATVLLEWIEREQPVGRILEVGCAGGYFLKAARDRGWTPVGVEISPVAARFARDQLGLEVHTGTLASVSLPAESIDAAYLGDVLEHVPDPLSTLRQLHQLLRPGGVLLIAGPVTLNSLDRRLGLMLYRWLGRTKILRQPPYHLTEFTPATLQRSLVATGFAMRWIRQSKIPPTWTNVRKRPSLEHAFKFCIDAPNWLLTSILGRFGDRAIVAALKPGQPA